MSDMLKSIEKMERRKEEARLEDFLRGIQRDNVGVIVIMDDASEREIEVYASYMDKSGHCGYYFDKNYGNWINDDSWECDVFDIGMDVETQKLKVLTVSEKERAKDKFLE